MSATAYLVAAYGTFVGLMGAYVGILVPRTRRRRRELAAFEEQGPR